MRVEKREALTEAMTQVVDATQHVELVAKLAQAEARFSGKEAALWKVAPPPQVSFQWKNPDFLSRNPDFLSRNLDFLFKNVDI